MLEPARIVEILKHMDRPRYAEHIINAKLVLLLIRAVLSRCLHRPADGLRQRRISDRVFYIIGYAVRIQYLGLIERAVRVLESEDKFQSRIHDRLLFEDQRIVIPRNCDIRKNLEIGTPACHRSRAPLAPLEISHGELTVDLTLFEMYFRDALAVIRIHVHVLGSVLRRARTESVHSERIFVSRLARVVVVLASGVKLAVHKLPIVAPLSLVVSERNAASAVVNLDRVVGKYGYGYHVAEALARFIDGVRDYFENGLLAAVKTVGAENDRRALADSVRTLERNDRLFGVALFFLWH